MVKKTKKIATKPKKKPPRKTNIKKPNSGFASNPKNINRKGRPKKGHTFTDVIKEYMNEPVSKKSTKTRKRKLIEKLFRMADAGNAICLKYIIDRVDGSPTQTITGETEVTYRIGKPKELKK
jgi:hypothetical protein